MGMTLPNKQELRRLWFKVHKWLGLCLALPVLLIFLSGSVLVWRSSVDDLLHPRRYVAARAAQPPSFYLAAVQRALRPDERIASLTFPQERGSIVALVVAANGASMQGRERYFLDPVTGRVLDRASEISGPLRIVALPLIILALTGATISFPHFFNRLTGETAAVQAEMTRFLAPPLPQPRLSLAQALAAAGAPEQRKIESVAWPTVEDSEWTVTTGGGQFVTVDDLSGQANDHPTTPRETTARLMRRIHDGTGMPLVWQIVIFVSGLFGATMAITGVIMWLKGQVRDVRMRRRRAA